MLIVSSAVFAFGALWKGSAEVRTGEIGAHFLLWYLGGTFLALLECVLILVFNRMAAQSNSEMLKTLEKLQGYKVN